MVSRPVTMKLVFDTRGVMMALTQTAAIATEHMANDTREKTVNYIMGNRTPNNPFPKNKINLRTGAYYKNSVARPYPKSPKSYTKPKQPIALSQVAYAKDRGKTVTIGGRFGANFNSPVFVVGPIGGNGLGIVPAKLERGGNTSSWFREVKRNGQTVRWEFIQHRPKSSRAGTPSAALSKNTKRPARYASWRDVNAAMARNGTVRRLPKTNSAEADLAFIAQGWQGPKTFRVRPRPYISRAWERVRKRSKWYINRAANSFPNLYRRHQTLITAA